MAQGWGDPQKGEQVDVQLSPLTFVEPELAVPVEPSPAVAEMMERFRQDRMSLPGDPPPAAAEILGGHQEVDEQRAHEIVELAVLQQGTNAILGLLTPDHRDMILYGAAKMGVAPHIYIAALLSYQGHQGLLSEAMLNPTWLTRSFETAARAEDLCEGPCKLIYKPGRHGQRYCCSTCGRLAAGEVMSAAHSEECSVHLPTIQAKNVRAHAVA
jgi:hypothetical protein